MMHLFLQVSIFLLKILLLHGYENQQQPHIIFIYADDLGWNDISLNGSPQIPTPNIDALGVNGLVLKNYYGEWLCTPSRGAFLTGKYPLRLGLQHSALKCGETSGLPLNEVTLAQYLKALGYSTHMIGKWHLGYQTKQFTPTYRGFDSHLGYLNGYIDYYDHTIYEESVFGNKDSVHYYGLDFHNGTEILKNQQGKYATHLFTETAEEIIRNHDTSKPLFLYLAHLAAHAGNLFKPEQAPAEVISKFKYIKNINRRIHAAIISILDEGVGAVFRALHQKDMLKNSIFMFVSDNGAEISPKFKGYGSNYPLRGNKATPWEGGIRLPAIIWSPVLNLTTPKIADHLMHVTDWLPTLYRAAGGDPRYLPPIDGFDMLDTLVKDSPSPRSYILQNLDPVAGTSAFRVRDLKLVNGTNGYDSWYGPSGLEGFIGPSTFEWVFKEGSIVGQVLKEMGLWSAGNPQDTYNRIRINCQQPPPRDAYSSCQPDQSPCLFNITDDPCEYKNIADQYPEEVAKMMNAINMYKLESMEPQSKPSDPQGDPMCHNFMVVPFFDPEYYYPCDFAKGSVGDKETQ